MNNLAKIRGEHRISQTELAEKIGVTKQGLCFNEKTKCSIQVALKAAEILGENVFDILGTDALVLEPKTEKDKEVLIKIIKGL